MFADASVQAINNDIDPNAWLPSAPAPATNPTAHIK
jgi:hypothetical protein